MANRRFMRPYGPSSYPEMVGQDWELGGMDPRLDEYYSNMNHYNSGPGYYLPPEQQAYSRRTTGLPFRMFVSGIHPQTTEEGISNIFSMYGIPLRIFKTRNKNNEPIGFVDFATQMEADNAIIGLDGKPPLYWKVTYSLDHTRRDAEYFEQYADAGAGFYDELEQHTPMHPLPGMVPTVVGPSSRAVPFPVPVPNIGAQSLPNPRRMANGVPSHPPCIICGTPAESACSKCKAPYCSINCQSADWNKHKNECVSPPALEPVKPRFSGAAQVVRPSTVSITELQPSRPASSTQLESAAGVLKPQAKIENPMTSKPHAYEIKVNGITPLNSADAALQANIAPAQPSGQYRPHPVNQKSPKKNGWVSNVSNMKAPPIGNSGPARAGSFPMKNASPKSAVTNGHARISPLNRPRPDIYAKLFTVNKLSPLRNKPCQVVVRATKAPDNFFIQYLNFKEMLDKLTNELQSTAQNAPPLMEPVLENSPCLAMCPINEKWFRAQIIKVWNDAVGVSFVDYGHRVKLSKTAEHVRMMEHEYAQKPFFAIKAKLAEVLPLEGSNWSEDVKTTFKTLVEDKTFIMEFVQSEGDLMVVRLQNSNGSDLGSHLVNKQMAKRISKQQEITDELDRIHLSTNGDSVVAPPPQVIYKTPQETAASRLLTSRMSSTMVSQNAQSVVTIVGACTNVSPMNQNNIQVQRPSSTAQSVSTQSNAAVSATSTSAQILPRSSVMANLLRKTSAPRVVASSILDYLAPSDIAVFSATVAFNSGFAIGTLIRNENDLAYEEFHCVVEGEPLVPDFKPVVGTKVSALSVAHGLYYRGYVSKSSGSSFSILYIDFGNYEHGVTTVQPLPSTFKVPELAVKFTPMSKEAERFAAQNIPIDAAFNLEVVSVEKGQFVVIKHSEFPDLHFKLEPWTTLIPPETPLQLSIPKASLETGYTSDVMITVADDLDQIFVQPIKDENMIAMTSLQEALNKHLDSSSPLKAIPSIGTYVASFFPEDNGFYRARVESVSGDSIKVHYIDFGNSCDVTLAELRNLPQELFKFPIVTYQVCLACVPKPASKGLPTSVKTLLSSLVNQLGTMLVIDSSNGSIDCTLTVDGKVVNQEVAELLEMSSKPAPPAMPKLIQSAPEEEPKPIVKHQVDNTLGFFRYEDGPFLDLPEGKIFQAMIFNVDSPQMIMMCEGADSILTQLGKLQDEMAEYASSVVLGHTPAEGEICIVRSMEDDGWYRGTCLQVISGGSTNSFQFLQVDFGSFITCFADDVRRIPKRFVECLPYVAQHAILKGCENITEISENLVRRSKELLPVNAPVEVKVESRFDTSYIVDIPSVYSVLKAEGLL